MTVINSCKTLEFAYLDMNHDDVKPNAQPWIQEPSALAYYESVVHAQRFIVQSPYHGTENHVSSSLTFNETVSACYLSGVDYILKHDLLIFNNIRSPCALNTITEKTSLNLLQLLTYNDTRSRCSLYLIME